jgi:hypothetical protein
VIRRLVALLVAVLLGAAPTPVVGAPSRSAPATSGALVISPAAPVVGQPYVVRGRVPGGARTVRLQVRGPAGWRAAGRGTSARTGAFALPRTSTAATRLRVRAPATRRLRAWTSRAVVVRPVVQSAALTLPAASPSGASVEPVATVRPAVAGRPAVLQRRLPAGWSDVAGAVQAADGRARFSAVAPAPGEHAWRVVLPAYRGMPAVRSASVATTSAVPRLEVTTADGAPVTSGTVYSRGVLALRPGASGSADADLGGRLRVRGNSTAWVQRKLSYKVKLDTATPLLGMPASKDWVLLANFYDRSLLRNQLGFEVSRRVGLPWTPRMVEVELWLDGAYRGLYQLGEGIEVGPDRVDIEVAEDDPAGGGYLLEADSWDDDKPVLTTDRGLQVYVDQPGDVGESYVAGVRSYLQHVEDSLYADGAATPVRRWRELVDVDSFVDWYLVNEVTKNVDASFRNSVWMQRDRGGRLAMGPVWDFDQSAGSQHTWGLSDPTGWHLRTNHHPHNNSQYTGPAGHWFHRMFADPWFAGRVAERWRQVRTSLLTLPAYVAARTEALAPAAGRNFSVPVDGEPLPIGPTFLDPPEGIFHDTWHAGADDLGRWVEQRVAWIDAQLAP